jgi:hypothetical protein
MGNYYDPMTHTPAEWRAMAGQKRQDAEDSFERCDTDGFVSQWASGCMAQLYEYCAQIAENGGKASFPALFDLDGQPVNAKLVAGKWDWCWLLLDGNGKSLGKFVPHSPSKPSTLERRGYREGVVEAFALVRLEGRDYCSVTPVKIRKPENWKSY